MTRARATSVLATVAAAAVFVDLFFKWVEVGPFGEKFDYTGWELSPFGPLLLVAFLLWELVRALGNGPRGAWTELTSFFLGAGAAILIGAGIVHTRWGSYYIRFHGFYAATWIGVGLTAVVLVCAIVRLLDYRRLASGRISP